MMERLTFDGNFCDIAQCRALPCPYDNNCMQKQMWERLKSFEDTGLSPEGLKQAVEIEEHLNECGSSIARVAELIKADDERRVLVLPCKAGTPVWRITQTFETYPDESEQYVRNDTFFLSDLPSFGKTVFLTREEAEKALEARNDDQ